MMGGVNACMRRVCTLWNIGCVVPENEIWTWCIGNSIFVLGA
jgi:hypothetical protein